VDGARQIDFTDPNPNLFGGVTLEANPASHVYVDDVEISGPPPPPITEKLVWSKTGGPPGGVGYDVRMRPDNPDIMYVTDAFSGVNMSTDGGRTWSASNKGILTRAGNTGDDIPVFCLTIDPHNNNTVWIGTQNVRGIYKSTDGGKTWVSKDKGVIENSGITFRGFTVDPRSSNIVYAAGELSSFAWAGQPRTCWGGADMAKGVIYKTTDGGENWSLIWKGDSLARYVWIDPRKADVLYVSTGIFDRVAANCDDSRQDFGGVGILKSVDAGKTWRVLGKANGLTTLRFGSLFMHPRNPDILLAGGGGVNESLDGGAFLTTDGGETWVRTLVSGWENITAVEFSTADPDIAYAAGGGVYRSGDGGRTWKTVNPSPYGPPGIPAGVPIDIQVDPRNPNRLFINNYKGGNVLSEDGGYTWREASRGYTGAQMHKVTVDPHDPQRVFAIGRSGIYRSIDGGDNWVGVNYLPGWFGEFGSMALDPVDSARVLLSPENEGALMLSTVSGNTWEEAFRHPGIPRGPLDYRQGQGFLAIAYAPSNPKVIYAGLSHSRRSIDEGFHDPTFGIYKSTDGGMTWRAASDANTAALNFSALAVHPRDEKTVYAATYSHGVFQTTDGGVTWQARNRGLKLLDVRAVTIDPVSPATLYAGLENGGVYKSTDAGVNWQQVSNGMDPLASVRDVAIDPAAPQVVYAADFRSGVFRSEDGGKLWIAVSKGLSTRAVKSLAISSDGGTLYAATEGEGVFRLDLKPGAEAIVTAVSAASFAADAPLAPDSIASLFGRDFADPTVVFTDSGGADATARLFVVTPTQINCLVPVGLTAGPATVRVSQQNRVVARGQVRIEPVAPGIFTANADGKGVPAAVALRIAVDGSQTQLPVFHCGATCTPAPIDLGGEGDQVILLLFGTGIRGGTNVSVRIGGLEAPVLGFAAQGQFVGLDQVNVRLPRALAGRGEVDVVLTVDGKAANSVGVRIK